MIILLFCLSSATDPTKHWLTDLDEAMKIAEKENKIVMLAFRDPEYYTYDTMNTQVFSTKEWKEFEEKEIVPVYLQVSNTRNNNNEKLMANYRLSHRHGVNYPPEYHFLFPDGKKKLYKTKLNIWQEGTNKVAEMENEIERKLDRYYQKTQGNLKYPLFTESIKSIWIQSEHAVVKIMPQLKEEYVEKYAAMIKECTRIPATLEFLKLQNTVAWDSVKTEYMALYKKLEGHNYWNTRSGRDEKYIQSYITKLSSYATKTQIDDLSASIDRYHELKEAQDKREKNKKNEHKRLTLRRIELENELIDIYENEDAYK